MSSKEILKWLVAELQKPNCSVDATNLAASILQAFLEAMEEDDA